MAERLVCFQEITEDMFVDNFVVERVLEKKKWVSYLRCVVTFDTETTSFIHNGQKVGYCYVWAMKIGDYLITGRYLTEFKTLCDMLIKRFNLSDGRRIIIWVHNLGFDFQFFRKYFNFSYVFAMDRYKPIKAFCGGIEFRDSYILTNSSLEHVGKNLRDQTYKKLVGDLDYSKSRHSETSLSHEEWEYIYNDVRVLYQCIVEKMEDENGILTNIPMTSTGYVRRFVRGLCYPKDDKKLSDTYRKLMRSLTIEHYEYNILKAAFQGGFTHGNKNGVGFTHKNVGSFDITSSYPTVCCARKFPMSKGQFVDCTILSEKMFQFYLDHYCCIIEATFYDIESKVSFDDIISISRCSRVVKPEVNNGRIMKANELTTTFTEVDYGVYKRFYKWSGMTINKLIIYAKGYLPKPIVEGILSLYGDKTTLKGVPGEEKNYMLSKNLLNATYGMMVTDIVRDEIIYNDLWDIDSSGSLDAIDKYNKSLNRFLFYPWGIWVTSYARERLFDMMEHCGDDYLYSDTDSVKVLNSFKHADFIKQCNEKILQDVFRVLDYHNIPREKAVPKTKDGVEKPLGVWDDEGIYDEFKTLGAKRYFVKKGDKYELTVAGISKKTGCNAIIRQSENKEITPFEAFDFGLLIPAEDSGKNTHYYIDDSICGYMQDYLGDYSRFESPSSVYLEGASYSLTISPEYDVLLSTISKTMYERIGV